MEVSPKLLKFARLQDGTVPFKKWFSQLRDHRARAKILARLARLRIGNPGSTVSVGESVKELKVNYGPGYRIYFGQAADQIIILLCGGDKRTQNEDIKKAKALWAEYKRHKNYVDC